MNKTAASDDAVVFGVGKHMQARISFIASLCVSALSFGPPPVIKRRPLWVKPFGLIVPDDFQFSPTDGHSEASLAFQIGPSRHAAAALAVRVSSDVAIGQRVNGFTTPADRGCAP